MTFKSIEFQNVSRLEKLKFQQYSKIMFLLQYQTAIANNLEERMTNVNKIIVIFFIIDYCSSKLLWNDNFQQYNTSRLMNSNPLYFMPVSSSTSNWYNYNMNSFEVKSLVNIPTTVGVQLSSNVSYTLCRNFTFEVGQQYQLSYSLYCGTILHNMTLFVYLNNKPISSLYIERSGKFASQKIQFYPQTQNSQFCFNQTHSFNTSFNGMVSNNDIIGTGGVIDNFTLHSIDTYFISFACSMEEGSKVITLISNTTYQQFLVDQLRNQYEPRYQNVGFAQVNYSSTDSPQQLIVVSITPDFSLPLNRIQFMPKFSQAPKIQLRLYFTCPSNTYYFISAEREYNISFAKTILLFFYQSISSIINFFRVLFSSYFLCGLISFESLSLYYIFLNVSVIPDFTKQIYHSLLSLSFKQQNIMNWIYKLLSIQPHQFWLQSEEQNISELIQDKKQDRIWFGTYGFSSLAFNNNADNLVLLSFFITKIILVGLFTKLLSNKLKKIFKLKIYPLNIILIQLIVMCPQFIISATTRMKASAQSGAEIVQKIIQILIIFFYIATFGLFLIYASSQKQRGKIMKFLKKQSHTNKKVPLTKSTARIKFFDDKKVLKVSFKKNQAKSMQIKDSDSLRNKNNYVGAVQFYNKITDGILFFSIPFFILFDNPLVLLVTNSFVISVKLIYSLVIFLKRQQSRAFLEIIINLVWVAHHSIYVVFYTYEGKIYYTQAEYQKIIQLGFFAILTVLIGYLLQLFKFVIVLFGMVRNILKKFIQLCKSFKQPKVVPITTKFSKNLSSNPKSKIRSAKV